MHVLTCPRCDATVSFSDLACAECGVELAFDRVGAAFTASTEPETRCANRKSIDCNWLAAGEAESLCGSCELTRTRPADADVAAMPAWRDTENAKRRLLVQLDSLGLPVRARNAGTGDTVRLRFDLLSSSKKPVTTGHANGVITVDLAEGDDLHRESLRLRFGEPYRTLLGHLRHEVGHFYWLALVAGTPWLDRFRERFGDERQNYRDALREHYSRDDDQSWTDTHVTRYAAAHPWEDWAESFAQYLHIQDTLDTAKAWGIRGTEPAPATFQRLVEEWLPLASALNALNHSMGQPDLYPFSLNERARRKLELVHDVVTGHGAHDPSAVDSTAHS